jgi:hypothetical protein
MNMPTISIVDQCKVRIAAFDCPKLGRVSQKTMDLTPHAGKKVRIWLDPDGSYSTDPKKDHYWQVAELDVPEIKYDRGDQSPGGEMEDASPAVPLPLDLTDVEVSVWSLPE